MDEINDPRTREEIEDEARLWAEELKDLTGRTAQEVIWDDEREAERDYEQEQRDIEADARWYFGY